MSPPRRFARAGAVGLAALSLALVLTGCRAGDDSASLGPLDHLPRTSVGIELQGGGAVEVDAWVAATAEHRRRGLMGITHLADGEGMFFSFDTDRRGGFWMFDTLIPLDIAFIDAHGVIGTILDMDPCGSDDPDHCPIYTPPDAYRSALEVPQGWFERNGVREADIVQLGEDRDSLD